MAQSNVSFEMNDKLIDRMEDLCDELGMSMEDAFQLFARKMVNEQGIPFEVTEKEYPVDEKEEIIEKAVKWTAIITAVVAAVSLIGHLIHWMKKRR